MFVTWGALCIYAYAYAYAIYFQLLELGVEMSIICANCNVGDQGFGFGGCGGEGGIRDQTLGSFVCTLSFPELQNIYVDHHRQLENIEEGSDGKVSLLFRILTLADATAGQHQPSSSSKASNFLDIFIYDPNYKGICFLKKCDIKH